MKILLDPVYTGKPSTCSTSYLMWEVVAELSKWRDDVFFYLMFPAKYLEDMEQVEWISERPFRDRVKIVPKRYDPLDRIREAFSFDDELMSISAIGASPYFDIDAVLTSRISQLGMYRMTVRESTAYCGGSFRAIIGLDEMPMFSFRDTVPWGDRGEIHTLANYALSDLVVINNLWTVKLLKPVAKEHLSPARAKTLMNKVVEAVPIKLQRLNLKTATYQDGEKFTLAFTGRITGTRNFNEVAELFRTHFSYPLGPNKDKVRFVVSTNSQSAGSAKLGEIDFIEFLFNDRAKFHQFLKHEANVVVNLSEVEDFSLSTYEPLLFGVPVIVPSRPWAEFLGPDYPFRVKSFTEAYALLNEFFHHYDQVYAAFKKWEETTWKTIVASWMNTTTSERVQSFLAEFELGAHEYIHSSKIGGKYKTWADAAQKRSSETVSLQSMIELEEGKLRLPLEKTPLMKRPDVNILKLLMYERGYVDTLEPGMMRRAQCKKD
jgi:hypothetical protein